MKRIKIHYFDNGIFSDGSLKSVTVELPEVPSKEEARRHVPAMMFSVFSVDWLDQPRHVATAEEAAFYRGDNS